MDLQVADGDVAIKESDACRGPGVLDWLRRSIRAGTPRTAQVAQVTFAHPKGARSARRSNLANGQASRRVDFCPRMHRQVS